MSAEIKSIIDSIFGEPRSDFGSGGWYEYNCPACAEANGGEPDNKYNMAVHLEVGDGERLWGHCWKCGYGGDIWKLVRKHGTVDDYRHLKDVVDNLNSGSLSLEENIVPEEEKPNLPSSYLKLDPADSNCFAAINYLRERGISKDIADRFNIGYTKRWEKLGGRIVIPSYDRFGDINYWVARDYTGNNKIKIINPKTDKKRIVFNERFINWYEPINIVEGPFDHIAVPNSIPLLGKTIDEDNEVYIRLYKTACSFINIMLDDDAIDNAYRIYRFLNRGRLEGRIRIIRCPEGYDPSDYYRDYGTKGIAKLIQKAFKPTDFEIATRN